MKQLWIALVSLCISTLALAQASEQELIVGLRTFIGAGRWSDALRIVERAQGTRSAELLGLMAQVQSNTFQELTAVTTLKRAIALAKNNPELELQLAWAELTAGDYEASTKSVERAAKHGADPDAVAQLRDELRVFTQVQAKRSTKPQEGTPAHRVWVALSALDTMDMPLLERSFTPERWRSVTGSLPVAMAVGELADVLRERFGAPEQRKLWIDPVAESRGEQAEVRVYLLMLSRPAGHEASIQLLRGARADPAIAELLEADTRALVVGLDDVDFERLLTRLPYRRAPLAQYAVVLQHSAGHWRIDDLRLPDGRSMFALAGSSMRAFQELAEQEVAEEQELARLANGPQKTPMNEAKQPPSVAFLGWLLGLGVLALVSAAVLLGKRRMNGAVDRPK